jgi:replicative DNA helicase
VLLAILQNNEAYKAMPVDEEYFTLPIEKDLINIIIQYIRQGRKIDHMLAYHELKKQGYSDTEIVCFIEKERWSNLHVSMGYLDEYFRFISEKAIAKHTESIKKQAVDLWWTAQETSDKLKYIEKFYSRKETFVDDDIDYFLEAYEDRKTKKNLILTWDRHFDSQIWLEKTWLCTIAARSSIWKTTYSMQLAQKLAKKWNKVAIYSMEMQKEEIMHKFLSVESWYPTTCFKNGSVNENDLWRAIDAYRSYGNNISMFTGEAWYGDVERYVKTHPELDVLVIDYLQQFTDFNHLAKSETKSNAIGKVTMGLKRLAQECNIAVVILSQVSRGTDSKEKESMPRLESLRESWNIEQDSDVVCILHRETRESNDSTLYIAKNRHGKTWEIKLVWDSKKMSIVEA